MKLFVVIFEFAIGYDPKDYGNLSIRLQIARARRIMGEVYALRSGETAEVIKDDLKLALQPLDKLAVLEVADIHVSHCQEKKTILLARYGGARRTEHVRSYQFAASASRLGFLPSQNQLARSARTLL